MINSRTITRIHDDKAKRVAHVFSESGYEFTVPAGFRDPRLKVGRPLDDESADALRESARAHERGRSARKAARRERRAGSLLSSGTITRIAHDGRRGRAFVDLDDQYALLVTIDQLVEAGLAVGKVLSPETVTGLRAAYDVTRIAGIIDRLTNYRPRTVAEIRRRLTEKGIEGPLAEAGIAARTGEAYGVLSDESFARWFAEHRGVPRGRGFRRLAPELRRLGVSDDALRTLEAEYAGDEALTIALERASRGLDLDDPKMRTRFVGRLARAGFGYGDAREYLDQRAVTDDALTEAALDEA